MASLGTFGLYCVLITLLAMKLAHGAKLGENCADSSECRDYRQDCLSNKCACKSGFYEATLPRDDGSNQTVCTVSEAVRDLQVPYVLSTKVKLSWLPPDDTTGPNAGIDVTGYVATIYNGSACLKQILVCENCRTSLAPDYLDLRCHRLPYSMITDIDNSTKRVEIMVIGLSRYRAYSAQVRAVKNDSKGMPSSVSFQTDKDTPGQFKSMSVEPLRDEAKNQVSLNVSWVPGKLTVPFNTLIVVTPTPYYINQYPPFVTYYIITEEDSYNYEVKNLVANWNYQIKVSGKHYMESEDIRSATIQASALTMSLPPAALPQLTVKQDSDVAQELSIEFPCLEQYQTNGTIRGFLIEKLTLSGPGNNSDVNSTDEYLIPKVTPFEKCPYQMNSDNVGGVEVLKAYNFQVRVIGEEFNSTVTGPVYVEIKEKAPIFRSVRPVRFVASTLDSLTVKVCSRCALDGDQGPITEVGLIVCTHSGDGCYSNSNPSQIAKTLNDYKLITWAESQQMGFNTSYWATPSNWIDDLKKDTNQDNVEYTIGSDKACANYNASVLDTFCNGPLPKDKKCVLTLVRCNSVGCGEYRSEEIEFNTIEDDDDGLSTGEIAAIVVACIVGALLLCGIAYVVIGKLRRPSYDA